MKNTEKYSLTILIIIFLLPIDNFALGAELFREFGGRPFNLFISGLIIFSIIASRDIISNRSLYRWQINFFIILIVGVYFSSLQFLINIKSLDLLIIGPRPPLFSYITQLGLMFSSVVFLVYLNYYFSLKIENILILIKKYFFIVAFLHMIVFLFDFFAIQGWSIVFIDQFITSVRGVPLGWRPTGLMTEPAHWGAFVSFVWPILWFKYNEKENLSYKYLSKILVIILIFASITTSSRTFLIIFAIQISFFLFIMKLPKSLIIIKALLITVFIFGASILITMFSDVFNVNESLSSAARLGSTLAAMDIASDYFLTGIGIGQFHYYLSQYAVSIITDLPELQDILTGNAISRASTFNFYIRLIVELGLVGFFAFMYIIGKSVSGYRILFKADNENYTGVILSLVGAMSFWLTQDSFLYSPAIFFIALGLAFREKIADVRYSRSLIQFRLRHV